MNKLKLTEANRYFENYISNKNNSQSTAIAYLTDYKQFVSYMQTNYKKVIYVSQIKPFHIMEYLSELTKKVHNKEIKIATKDRKFDSLVVFFEFLKSVELVDENIVRNFEYIRTKSKYSKEKECEFNPYILTTSDKEKILSLIINSKSSNKYRDLAIIQTLMETGVRRSTLLEMKWQEINFKDKIMQLHHVKTKNLTTVKISDSLCETLLDLKYVSNGKWGYIFTSNKGGQLSNSAYNEIINKYIKLARLDGKKVTGHSFRHSFITEQLSNNISPYKILKYTGHKRTDSLKPY